MERVYKTSKYHGYGHGLRLREVVVSAVNFALIAVTLGRMFGIALSSRTRPRRAPQED